MGVGISSIAPAVASTAVQGTAIMSASKEEGPVAPAGEQSERCDQLLDSVPGIEELQKDKSGVIESRRWKLGHHNGANAWVIDREKNAPPDGWMPKPNIAKLNFKPPIYELLPPEEPQFLAYAPADPVQPSDSAQLTTMTATFGAPAGTFQWHGRAFSFVTVKELPCFKSIDE